MLRLVHPAPNGQGIRLPKGRRSPALSLTDVEAMRLRAALRGLKGSFGTWPKLAEAMGLKTDTLRHIACGRNHPSPGVVLLAARVARSTVERILEAGPVSADRCPHCGASKGAP